MKFIRTAAVVLFAMSLFCASRAEEAKKEEKLVVTFERENLKKDPPIAYYTVLVKPGSVTTEIIPAVFRDLPDGTKQTTRPEKQIHHPVPAVYETREIKLVLDAANLKKLREMAEKAKRIEVTGERGTGEFKVSGINEKTAEAKKEDF